MEKSHRTNVLVTSCLKTPVDPHTKVPLAQYERERALDNRHYEKEMEYDSGSELLADDPPAKDGNALLIKDYRVTGDHIDLREFYFSNQEYYHKLEQLKKAHLQTMAELELMYRKKLDLKGASDADHTDRINLSTDKTGGLKKAQSALELRKTSDSSELSDEEFIDENGQRDGNTEKGLLVSPKEHIKNMWLDFSVKNLSSSQCQPFSSSLQSLPADCQTDCKPKRRIRGQRLNKRKQKANDYSHPRVTVPKPFQMTLRELELRKRAVKSRAEIERENEDLRRQLDELTECQRKFRASPVPAHVRLALYEEQQERDKEHRRRHRDTEQKRLHASQKPFSFLERERLKKEQKEAKRKHDEEEEERKKCLFKAKPVPRAVRDAASGERQKEEELYRAIKMQMRAREMLHSASMPPSMLARRLSEKQTPKAVQDDEPAHRPKINTEVPDFAASYRRFRKQLEKSREVRPVTACEPFQLRTADIASHKERIVAEIEAEIQSPKLSRWPYLSPRALSPSSSRCSSLSGSQECLTAKITDAAKKRQEAVRKVLEQRKRIEDEEEKWKEKQKQREKRLQKVITKRAQANDPHVALAQTCPSKLKEFRKQDLQRQREFQQEMREIQERVKGRPLLLEQVAQMNAKRAAEKLYSATLHGCGLSESFINSKAPKASTHRQTPSPTHSDSQTPPTYSKIRHEDHEDLPNLRDSLLDDYPDDYEEYDHDMEPGLMDRDEDEKLNVSHDSDEEKSNAERHSHGDEEDFDDDFEDDDECHKDDDIISKHSQSRRGSESSSSQHSNRSRTGSVN